MRTEDGYIVNKCLEGDSTAFGLLVDKYKSGVYALAYSRLKNFHDAEDIAQEVFIKAYRKLRTLRRHDSVIAWLYSITTNLCRDLIRSRSRMPDKDFIEDHKRSALEAISMESYNEELIFEKLHEALESLSETYREVITLYYLGGMDSVEIAKFLGTSPANIRQRLSRARAELKENLAFVSMAFEQRKLSPSFTFKIVERIKDIRIEPVPRIKGLPWYISLTTSAIFAIVGLNQHFTPYELPGNRSFLMIPGYKRLDRSKDIPVKLIEIPPKSIIPLEKEKGKDNTGGLAGRSVNLSSSLQRKSIGWKRHPDMPTGRLSFGTVALNNLIYAIGGLKEGWGTLSTVEAYDVITRRWLKKADLLTPRYGLSTCAVKGKIYAIGGTTTIGPTVLSTVEEYDPLLNRWRRKADMPTPRSGCTASVVNGKIYVIGGVGSDFITSLSNVEEYDPETDTWTKKANMPTARSIFCAEVVNGKIYAIGGQSSLWEHHKGMLVPIVEEYDPITDTWTRKADMPTSRCMFCTSVVNNKIYAIGGISMVYEDTLSIVEVYDPETDTWTTSASMPDKRFALSASACGSSIYVIGGLREMVENFFGLPTVEEFIPE